VARLPSPESPTAGEDAAAPEQTRPSPAVIVYIIAMLLLTVATTLTVWPANTTSPSWVQAMSSELRFVLVIAAGGALGTTLRVILVVAEASGASSPLKIPLIHHFLTLLWAVPLSILAYLVLRGVILSPAAPVSDINPFGLLLCGFFVGIFADTVIHELNAISKALLRSDPQLEERMGRIADALGVTTLDNYDGALCATILDSSGKVVPADEDGHRFLQTNAKYDLKVWFAPTSADTDASAQEIHITGGVDTERISFLVTPASDADISFAPKQRWFSFDPRKRSDEVVFRFAAPVTRAPCRLMMRVTQKNRLVAVLGTEAKLGEFQ
jgi:hypothetical protein